jgi:hypothetical protein
VLSLYKVECTIYFHVSGHHTVNGPIAHHMGMCRFPIPVTRIERVSIADVVIAFPGVADRSIGMTISNNNQTVVSYCNQQVRVMWV